ncbi:hypothetical protein N7452_005140 [Penicillium brevicompactum]|uniref:Uncharacterized protein n=1 Tax=Penicillium brevicompactum TaxID=5074 RepID=A0A9W9QI60_PENBR|nr:hypothetical protein N7452_005140 [Penicillium brevicompactum]
MSVGEHECRQHATAREGKALPRSLLPLADEDGVFLCNQCHAQFESAREDRGYICCDDHTEVGPLYALHQAQHADTERATALISSGQLAAAAAAAESQTPNRKRAGSAGPSHERRSSDLSTNSDPSTSNERGLDGGDAMMTLMQLFVPSDESPLE